MDAAQSTHEKRTINVKDFLEDFHSDVSDQHLLKKYNLTPSGLETFYQMLQERGILKSEQVRARKWGQLERAQVPLDLTDEKSSYICPRCLASHETMFDICPSCGVSFQELISQEKSVTACDKTPQDAKTGEHKVTRTDSHPAPASRNRSRESIQEIPAHDCIPKFQSFDDSLQEIVSGVPLESIPSEVHFSEVPCTTCESATEPGIRNIYDRKRALQAVVFAGIFLAVGFLGVMALSFFEGQSSARLAMFVCTVAVILFAVIFATTGAFLLLAREKVYICPNCHRAYPRI